VARGVSIRRGPLILDAGVGLMVTLVAAAMVGGIVPPTVAIVIIVPVAAAYVLVLAVPRHQFRAVVPESMVEIPYEPAHDRPRARHESWLPVLLLPLALAGVVGGSFVMVHSALDAQPWLHLSDAVLGTIVLAALTSLPNLMVALHFARRDRGTALFSSAMNSNSINLVGGLIVPALWVGRGSAQGAMPYFIWLIDLTLLAVLAPLARGRLSRAAGAVIIAIYVIFVVLRVLGI
jgi:Ca2+/Na+ antiporter